MRRLREIPCRMLTRVVRLYIRAVSVFGKKFDAVCVFLGEIRVVLRFSDPSYTHLLSFTPCYFMLFYWYLFSTTTGRGVFYNFGYLGLKQAKTFLGMHAFPCSVVFVSVIERKASIVHSPIS